MSGGNHSVSGTARRSSEHSQSSESVRRLLRLGHILGSVLEEYRLADLTEPEEAPLTPSQLDFLQLICAHSGMQVGQVARRLGVSAAAASKALHRLEQAGLVERTAVPGDRRVACLSPSSDARRLVARHERGRARRLKPVIEGLSGRERDHLCALLERLCFGLVDHCGRSGETCLRCGGHFDPGCVIRPLVDRCGFEAPRGRTT